VIFGTNNFRDMIMVRQFISTNLSYNELVLEIRTGG